ncbi:hypothetical protein U1T56_09650 [Geminicoccaceae bacterium SYSU G07066]|uniref:Uncharacterized protein n=1 Tax=Benzoatithermus flavus TaxID=3108223 RepID=A0ABU8XSQ6_9PROT
MARGGWDDVVFAFHDEEEIGPKMLARIARRTGLEPGDLEGAAGRCWRPTSLPAVQKHRDASRYPRRIRNSGRVQPIPVAAIRIRKQASRSAMSVMTTEASARTAEPGPSRG